MTTNQLFFAIAGLMVTLFGMAAMFFKWYLDARFTTIDNRLQFLTDHMVDHIERIAALEAKQK